LDDVKKGKESKKDADFFFFFPKEREKKNPDEYWKHILLSDITEIYLCTYVIKKVLER